MGILKFFTNKSNILENDYQHSNICNKNNKNLRLKKTNQNFNEFFPRIELLDTQNKTNQNKSPLVNNAFYTQINSEKDSSGFFQ